MQTVLITGASSGIGEAFAKEYARRGARLILVARRKAVLEDVAHTLNKEYGSECMVIAEDLSETGAAKRISELVKEKGWNIDVLVNNAGFPTKGLLDQSDFERQHQEINVNIMAVTELTYLFIGDMRKRGQGTVINIASAAAFNPCPYNAVYAATKAYVLSFTQALSYEYGDKGIHVLAVCPQATDTHFFDDFNKMEGKMRKPEDVVRTTFQALKKGKTVAMDGFLCQMQGAMPRVLSRKRRVKITGRVCKEIWG